MVQVFIFSIICSFTVSFLMMKFHMFMIKKWMNDFFERESEFIKKEIIIQHKDR